MLGPGERDADGSNVATERRSFGCETGTGEAEEEGAPPPVKKEWRLIGAFAAAAGAPSVGAWAARLPKDFSAPALTAGGAAGEEERVTDWSPVVPKLTTDEKSVSNVVLRQNDEATTERWVRTGRTSSLANLVDPRGGDPHAVDLNARLLLVLNDGARRLRSLTSSGDGRDGTASGRPVQHASRVLAGNCRRGGLTLASGGGVVEGWNRRDLVRVGRLGTGSGSGGGLSGGSRVVGFGGRGGRVAHERWRGCCRSKRDWRRVIEQSS